MIAKVCQGVMSQCKKWVHPSWLEWAGKGRFHAVTASDGRDVFRDGHWAVLGLGCSQLWSELDRNVVRGGQ